MDEQFSGIMSGNSYVSARLRGDDNLGLLKIRIAVKCRHLETICPECAHEWARDYEIFWHRTNGGRRLRSRITLAR